jgi:hypothetical protein
MTDSPAHGPRRGCRRRRAATGRRGCGTGTRTRRRRAARSTVDDRVLPEEEPADEGDVGEAGIEIFGSLIARLPTKPSPIRPDRPSPEWSAQGRSPPGWRPASASGRRRAARTAAAEDAGSAPIEGEPVMSAAAKPQTAPMIIMPSTPRLSTPERSTTSSPIAASSSGVAAVMMVRRIASTCPSVPLRGLRPGEARTDLVEDQRVAGEHEEQQQPLEDARHLVRDARRSAPPRRRDRSAPGKAGDQMMPSGFSRPRKATMMAVKP